MNKPLSAYILLGPEMGEKLAFIEKIKKDFSAITGEAPEEHRFFAFETAMKDVVTLLRNGSLFASSRIVHLMSVETITRKGDIAMLKSYLLKPMENTCLLLQSDTTRVESGLKSLIPKEGQKIFWELFEDQKRGWIVRYFREAQLTVTQDAVEVLLEMVDNNTQDLKNECEKFVLFYQPGTKITGEDVEQYIYHSKEENVFTLFERIAERELEASLEILSKILLSRETVPTALLAGLNWQFKKLLAFTSLLDQHYSSSEAFSKLNIRWKKNQKVYAAGARSYSLKELRNIISLIARYDTWLRSDKGDIHPLLLSMFIHECIASGRLQPA